MTSLRPITVLLAAACVCGLVPASAAAKPANPCLDSVKRAALLCPDLKMTKPFGLALDRKVVRGRVVLRAGNSVDSVGLGPAELHGVRASRLRMKARQRIYKRAGGRIGISTGASLYFKAIPGQGRYWKWNHAAQFELWRRDSNGERIRRSRIGRKAIYCLRDLSHTRPLLRRSPRKQRYPACNQKATTQRITLGTSVGWSDVYPASYHEQWIDVTGLRGCFDYVHIADPDNGIFESNENNNKAYVTVRLPFRAGKQNCPGRAASPAPAPAPPSTPTPDPYGYGY